MYCTIPFIRGRYRSRPTSEILAEVEHFAGLGVREFILVAQDLTKYNHDGVNLVSLVRSISKIKGVHRIRLHYVYPHGVTDELVDEIATNDRVCKYLDIPMQHVAPRLVGLMNRRGGAGEYLALVNKLRARIPDIAIRSTFMVGFPTETDAEFAELCGFIQTARLDFVGFFAYSRERGTRAYSMEQIPANIRRERLRAIERLQSEILQEKNRVMLLPPQRGGSNRGEKPQKVICDYYDGVLGYSITRTEHQSPEVDPCVIVYGELTAGEVYTVKITGTHKQHLIGEIV